MHERAMVPCRSLIFNRGVNSKMEPIKMHSAFLSGFNTYTFSDPKRGIIMHCCCIHLHGRNKLFLDLVNIQSQCIPPPL